MKNTLSMEFILRNAATLRRRPSGVRRTFERSKIEQHDASFLLHTGIIEGTCAEFDIINLSTTAEATSLNDLLNVVCEFMPSILVVVVCPSTQICGTRNAH